MTEREIQTPHECPQPQIVVGSCKLSRIIDGDTVEVEIVRRVRVRLLDCWAPETKRTKHSSEKPLGLRAKAALQKMAPVGSECTLAIEPDGDLYAGDGLTFGRVLGRVWVDDKISIAEQMRLGGYTFATKQELETFLTNMDRAQAQTRFDEL